MNEQELRDAARKFFDIGIKAADPVLAVQIELLAHPLPEIKGQFIVFAIGKAALSMVQEAVKHIPTNIHFMAIAITNAENMREVEHIRVFTSGHPVPDEDGLKAAHHIKKQALAATTDDYVLCLISGGGSALLPAPLPGLSLNDKKITNTLLLESGLDITQMNLVRQHLSELKGGGLARLCYPARVRSLIVSDVMGNDARTIASGPTANMIGTVSDARQLMHDHNLWQHLPTAVQHKLSVTDYKNTKSHAVNTIIASNRKSLVAIEHAAKAWNPTIVSECLTGDVQTAAKSIVDYATKNRHQGPQLFIWGGETTVKVKGNGLGGRNQELTLRVVLESQRLPNEWVFLSGGTDGRDGPTDAAGAIVSNTSLAKMAAKDINLSAVLNNNDSYPALTKIDDLLITGPTGTNVADIQLLMLP